MKNVSLYLFVFLFLLLGCDKFQKSQETSNNSNESALNENSQPPAPPKVVEEVFAPTIENIIGCWVVPKSEHVSIQFLRDGSFHFMDFSTEGQEYITGSVEISGHDLYLLYDDRPKQKFYFYAGSGADSKNFYIKGYPLKTTKYYFVKSKPIHCQ